MLKGLYCSYSQMAFEAGVISKAPLPLPRWSGLRKLKQLESESGGAPQAFLTFCAFSPPGLASSVVSE